MRGSARRRDALIAAAAPAREEVRGLSLRDRRAAARGARRAFADDGRVGAHAASCEEVGAHQCRKLRWPVNTIVRTRALRAPAALRPRVLPWCSRANLLPPNVGSCVGP